MTNPAGDEPVADRSGLRYAFRALKHRDFALFWIGAAISNIGGWLLNLTIPYIIFQETHSALWVGLVSVFQFVPQVVMGPLGGVLADQMDRRRMLFYTQTGLAVSATVVWIVVASGVKSPLLIMSTVGLIGFFNGLNMPSWQAFVNDLVPREDLNSAVALNSFQFNAARAIGPALAGILLYLVGPSWSLLYNAISYGAVIVALALMRPHDHPRAPKTSDGVFKQFTAAIRYLPTQPGIVMALTLALVVGFLVNPMAQFTIVFAGSVFHIGPAQLGLMGAAMGIGALLALPAMAGWSHVLTLAKLAKYALFIQAVGMAGFALAPNAVVGGAFLIFVGGGFLITMSSSNTAIQLIVADRIRGRVMAIRIMTYMITVPLGSTILGAISDRIGPRVTVFSAAVTLVVAGIIVSLLRGRVRLSRLMDPHDDAVH